MFTVSLSDGVLQPFRQLGWWKWMYRLSPFTYLIEGLLGQGWWSTTQYRVSDFLVNLAIGKQIVECSSVEYVSVIPPPGQLCSEYMATYIQNSGGYLQDPSASDLCSFCPFRTTDEYLAASFNISYSHRWRNFGFMFAFIAFNVSLFLSLIENLVHILLPPQVAAVYFFTFVFRIRRTQS